MDITPVELPQDADAALFDAPPGASWTRMPSPKRGAGETLRYRGLALDLSTGDAFFHESPIALTPNERALLIALMRRAGQIISVARLAEQIGCAVSEVAAVARLLSSTLAKTGACCQPRRVEGLGYVLWS